VFFFKILQKSDDSTLKLVNIDDNKKKGMAPAICLKIVQSSIFTTIVMIVVLANTIFTATIKHTHDKAIDQRNRELYHRIEVEHNTMLLNETCRCSHFTCHLLDVVYIVFRFGSDL
jgi:hypothetical protein